ncbi:MAG: hypothetical protein ACRBCL_15710 [Maritimibacter sp.]
MQLNSSYIKHQPWLLPALTMMILEWQASDLAERTQRASPQSYMWRAGFYDVVMLVSGHIHGPQSEYALAALSLYGETVDEYLKEFGLAQPTHRNCSNRGDDARGFSSASRADIPGYTQLTSPIALRIADEGGPA